MAWCGTMLPVRGNQGELTRHDCEPSINTVGSGAMNVGRRPCRESMMVGRDRCSIASRVFN